MASLVPKPPGRCVGAVLDGAWSHLSKALAAQGRAQLVPMLDASKPAWLAAIQLVRRGAMYHC